MSISIRGLASGLDIDGILEKLMAIERRPIVNMAGQQQLYQQRIDGWRDVNTRLYNLRQACESLQKMDSFRPVVALSSNDSIATASAKNIADFATYELEVSLLAARHRIASHKVDDVDADLKLTGTLTINDQIIDIEADDSLFDIKAKLNQAGTGLRASIIDNHLVLESLATGSANAIHVTETEGTVMENLGFIDSEGSFLKELQAATDAEFTVNGLNIVRSSNTISDVVDGVTFNLTGLGTARIDVSEDFRAVVDKFEAFVNQFNSTYRFMLEKLGKEGLMQGDSALARIRDQVRGALMDTIGLGANDNIDQAAVLGFKFDWKSGILNFDKTKFMEALKEDPGKVQALWQGTEDKEGFTGIAHRLDAVLENALRDKDGIVSLRQNYYSDLIAGLDKRIEAVEARVEMVGERLVRQWTALEKALQELSSQGAWLSQQIQILNMSGPGMFNS